MAAAPPVSVVVVHWEAPDRIEVALDAWARQTAPVRVTIVDNGSGPAARRRVAELADRSGAELVDAGGNLGFGPGANVGLERFLTEPEAGEWVVVAPHDALPAPDCIEVMLAVLADRENTGLACADVGDDHVPVVDPYFGGMMVPRGVADLRAADVARTWGPLAAVDRDVPPGWEPAGYPHGTLLMARRSLLEDVGLFDPRYFSYCEEADLGVRARAAGWDVALVRGAEVRNPGLGTPGPLADYLMVRNTLLLVRDHFGRYHATVRLTLVVVGLLDGLVRPARRPWLFVPRARWRAIGDHLRGRYGPPPGDLAAAP